MTRLAITLILALLAAPAFATPWDIPDGNGGWKQNPECTSQRCHDTGMPDKPRDPKTDRDPLPQSQEAYCCIKTKSDGKKVKWCVGGADFETPADRACAWFVHPVGGVIGDE